MLSSSSEYLMALRERDFLLFLEWPNFVAKKYGKPGEPLGGDALMDCLVFEWLSYGFRDEDIEHMTILYAISELTTLLHSGILMYQLMTTTSALFSCMAFQALQLDVTTFPLGMNERDIFKFMDKKTRIDGSPNLFNERVSLARQDFLKQTSLVKESQVYASCKKIYDINFVLHQVGEYKDNLYREEDKEKGNSLCYTRLGIVEAFQSYLKKQTELGDKVLSEINDYVTLLRKSQPKKWEEKYLDQIAPPSFFMQVSKTLLTYCAFFFSKIIPEASLDDKEKIPRAGGLSH
ncbi:helical bundle domain-containing protein [Legionella saoudiensis]|uniref:helical bundle domain-containing protein n=1 Tax=Legionella saoudiensis TaxID=1750561 RepID=UPI000730A4E8|nr:helical bundle domain-containing protein [Legionella saoudiensis]